MYIFAFLTLLIPFQALAKAPECPGYSSKKECLNAVDQDFEKLLDFIRDEFEDKEKDKLILATRNANDVKYYESLACEKTCLN
ncbi:MAG: hypothetical protein HYX35_00585 [Proteobacteria bacterium]|nr:hypothetical protein [Pseudomonadota bacterium]